MFRPPFSVSFETTSLHREAAKADIASRSTMAARSVLEERNARTERIVMRKDRSRALRKINGKFLSLRQASSVSILQGTIWIAAMRAFFAMSFDIVLRRDTLTPRRAHCVAAGRHVTFLTAHRGRLEC